MYIISHEYRIFIYIKIRKYYADCQLECTGCGAPLKFPKNHKVLICPFCGVESVIVGLDQKFEELNPTTEISPFTTKKQECQKELLQWLIEGDLTPDDLLLHIKIKDIQGIYLPLLGNAGSFISTFGCSVGYNKREKEVFINAQGRKDSKTQTVVELDSYSGTCGKEFRLLEYAFSNTSSKGSMSRLIAHTPERLCQK